MVTEILDNTVYGSSGNPKLLGNNSLLVKGSLDKDVFLGDIRDMVSISHGW